MTNGDDVQRSLGRIEGEIKALAKELASIAATLAVNAKDATARLDEQEGRISKLEVLTGARYKLHMSFFTLLGGTAGAVVAAFFKKISTWLAL